jgi:hypothetical protein
MEFAGIEHAFMSRSFIPFIIIIIVVVVVVVVVGHDSSVGITTRYWLDGPAIDS